MCVGLTEAHVSHSLPNKLFMDISQKESLFVQYFVAPTQLALFTDSKWNLKIKFYQI